MPILLGSRSGRPGKLRECHLCEVLDRAAVALGGFDDLRDEMIESQLRDLLDARHDGRLGRRRFRASSPAARHHGGCRLGGLASSLRHDGLIDIPGDPALTVAEGLRHDFDVDAGGEHERGGDVPQIV
ncbi:hypothetical protein [Streptomyces kasugaensis]|uniref:hypothetical protein n=1 Tax=Streptomyces kasugaensis TaxID=1946 RepID=UPI001F5F87A0|nr:hypothetical protein [Streptomyces kasugaensis]